MSAANDSLVSTIDALVSLARQYTQKPLDKSAQEELNRVDALFGALCSKYGVWLPEIPLPPGLLPTHYARLPHCHLAYYTAGPGIPLHPSAKWFQAMQELRGKALSAGDVDPNAAAEPWTPFRAYLNKLRSLNIPTPL